MSPPPITLAIDLGPRSYPIHIGAGLLTDRRRLEAELPAGPLLVVSNTAVAPLYLPRLTAALAGRQLAECVLPDGEAWKTLQTLARVYDRLAAARVNRDGAVLALGGGVVGDIAGFAAATWQRGIAYAQLPTTLLAQVDSSVGGKTGVNHPAGKNLIGAFHQPNVVIADLDTLATLPDRELRAGLAEVIKYGLIRDRGFLDWIERELARLLRRDTDALAEAVRRCCVIKAEIVALDERESGPRALLNLGHTFGHAIEAAAGYGEWLHGEAIAIGMVLAAETSARLGWLDRAAVTRVRELLGRAGLPVSAPRIGVERARELMAFDKKVLGGKVRLVLLKSLGEAILTGDYDPRALEAVLEAEVA
ncbi:MAG TPA: 3-dehydroquinate synthase [Steroidobacteraceae bacterium]|nr:3-dehydroquinate synthase [Steroidobacteraceae bacterium]